MTGTASFASEQLDLTIDPESKGIRIITLRSPLYVRGTFKNPQAGVKPGPLIARGAVAAALATLVRPPPRYWRSFRPLRAKPISAGRF